MRCVQSIEGRRRRESQNSDSTKFHFFRFGLKREKEANLPGRCRRRCGRSRLSTASTAPMIVFLSQLKVRQIKIPKRPSMKECWSELESISKTSRRYRRRRAHEKKLKTKTLRAHGVPRWPALERLL